ncbi:MAG: hypothetical protein ACE5IY_23685 [bacterium]
MQLSDSAKVYFRPGNRNKPETQAKVDEILWLIEVLESGFFY